MTSKLILPCFNCRDEHRRRNLKRIKDKYYCRSCAIQIRKQHREETIEQTGIREELTKLKSKMCRESKAKHHKPKIVHQKASKCVPLTIKGSSLLKSKQKSSSYITFDERRDYLRILVRSGLNYDEAKERLRELLEQMNRTQKKLRAMKKSEEEIESQMKVDKMKLLEGLR
jgi:hypothetical protein